MAPNVEKVESVGHRQSGGAAFVSERGPFGRMPPLTMRTGLPASAPPANNCVPPPPASLYRIAQVAGRPAERLIPRQQRSCNQIRRAQLVRLGQQEHRGRRRGGRLHHLDVPAPHPDRRRGDRYLHGELIARQRVLKRLLHRGGAPSPTWQQGAMTTRVTFWLETPWLAARMLAVPPPTAVSTAVAPFAWMETTLLLLVLHETARSVRTVPSEHRNCRKRERLPEIRSERCRSPVRRSNSPTSPATAPPDRPRHCWCIAGCRLRSSACTRLSPLAQLRQPAVPAIRIIPPWPHKGRIAGAITPKVFPLEVPEVMLKMLPYVKSCCVAVVVVAAVRHWPH